MLIAGVSTRAAAESAARAGYAVTAIDAYADLDQHPSVRGLSLPRDFGAPVTAGAAARAARTIDCDAVAYVSSFENHPRAVSALAAGRALWGNPPEVLRCARDPVIVADRLRSLGAAAPMVFVPGSRRSRQETAAGAGPDTPRGRHAAWLVKPLASGGGRRVRPWRHGEQLPRGCYLQEWVEGTPGSVVFVAGGGQAIPVGVSRQLVGDPAFGASGYRYCGSILTASGDGQFACDAALLDAAGLLARAAAAAFGLVGVNGVDFIARDGVPYAIEVNPRWCASMELVERAYRISMFAVHRGACVEGVLPRFDLDRARRRMRATGKAIVFARREVIVGDTHAWLGDPTVRDVPRPGERIRAHEPVCTVFADGRDAAACRAALIRRARQVYAELDAWRLRVA